MSTLRPPHCVSARPVALAAVLIAGSFFATGCTLSVGPNDGRNAAVARENSSSTSMTLKRMLEAEDPQVRALVAKELGEIGPSAIDAVPALHRLIEDPDRHVRLEAARALMLIDPNDRIAVPSLVMIINDPATSLDDRLAALTLLQQAGPKGQGALAMHNAAAGNTQGAAMGYSTTQPVRNTRTVETHRSQPGVDVPNRTVKATDVPPESSSVTAPPSSSGERTRVTTEERTRTTVEQAPAPDVESKPEPTPVPRLGTPGGTDPSSTSGSVPPAIAMVGDNSPAAGQVVVEASAKTTSATQPATATIPGLAGLDAAAAPQPDIHLYGLHSYTSTQANLLREWIQKQPTLTESERQARFRDFHRWRTEQDRLIYQKALQR